LGHLRLVQESAIHEATLLRFRLQVCGLAKIGLIGEHNKKFCALTIRSVFHHPRCDLANLQCMIRARVCRDGRLARNSDSSYESAKGRQKEN
jgi:hypothetical protein